MVFAVAEPIVKSLNYPNGTRDHFAKNKKYVIVLQDNQFITVESWAVQGWERRVPVYTLLSSLSLGCSSK